MRCHKCLTWIHVDEITLNFCSKKCYYLWLMENKVPIENVDKLMKEWRSDEEVEDRFKK